MFVEFELCVDFSLMEEFDLVYICYGALFSHICVRIIICELLCFFCKMQGFLQKQQKSVPYGHFAVTRHTAKTCAVKLRTAKPTRGAHL